jgi:hypothetical protein
MMMHHFCTRVKMGFFFSWTWGWPSGEPGMVLERF